jgi:hypothetical protein
MKKDDHKITKQEVRKAVSDSSKIEGQSFSRARKNESIINMLKKHGRAFSV